MSQAPPSVPRKNEPSHTSTGLRGNLGTFDLVMTVIAYNGPMIILAGFIPVIIGFGNGLGAPLLFLTLGVVVGLFAVSVNAMAARMTHPGAFYTYITAGIGRPVGLAAGFLAMVAYAVLAAGTYPLIGISGNSLLTTTFGVSNLPPWWIWAAVAWVLVSVLTLFNIQLSAKVLATASLCEIVVVLLWNVAVQAKSGPEGRSVDVVGEYFSGSFALAAAFAVLALTGFEALQVFRSETRDSYRTVPRATLISVVVLVSLYALSSYSYIVAYGSSSAVEIGAADPTGSVLASISSYVHGSVADIANVLLTTSSFAACLAIQNIIARYLFSLGRDGVFTARMGTVSEKHGSPMFAAATAGLLTLLGFAVPALFGATELQIFASETGVGGFTLLILWLLTSVAVLRFFRTNRLEASAWQVVVAPILAGAALAILVFFAITHFNEILGQTDHMLSNLALTGLAGVALGGVVLALWLRGHRPDTYARIGAQTETID